MSDSVRATALPVSPPYRLDFTVAALRRFSTNLVDVVAPDGTYMRAHRDDAGTPHVIAVRQTTPAALDVRVVGDGLSGEAACAFARRTLGTERFAAHFDASAARIPWLAGIASRMRGVRSPRYATLWEACVNAVVFQQVSIHAAGAILGRVVRAIGTPLDADGVALHTFFEPHAFVDANDTTFRAAGLSVAKIATLRRVAAAIEDGTLVEAELEARSSATVADELCTIKGIGPWTAAVILLRGLGRLDVFPENDSGVARSLLALTGERVDVGTTLAALAPEQGMLYYHLLLARLEARGEIAAAAGQGQP